MRFGFVDDRKDLDFLAEDVIEDPELVHAETELRSTQPAQALDSTFRDFGGLVPQMRFKRRADRSAMIGGEAANAQTS